MNDMTDKEFLLLREFTKNNYGINLNDEKKMLVFSRLRTELIELKLNNFTEYYNYLINDKSGYAAKEFINRISTNHTFFMREAKHFDFFRESVLPWIESSVVENDLRIWCAACSTGEEPYTLQMIIEDYFDGKTGWNTETLATDISTAVLDKAASGIYTNESVSVLPDVWRKKYFHKYDENNVEVLSKLKNKITFRQFNLMEKVFPFNTKFQVIFVRNVMIYFDSVTRDRLVEKLYDWMEPGGYLFIGHSESLNRSNTGFKYIKPALYRK